MQTDFKRMMKIMRTKGYPVSVQETAIGTIEWSRDQKRTAKKVEVLLKQDLTAREMVKALQLIIAEDDE